MLCELYKSVMHRSRIKCWWPKVWRMEEVGVRGKGHRLWARWEEQVCITVRTVSNNILATGKSWQGRLSSSFLLYILCHLWWLFTTTSRLDLKSWTQAVFFLQPPSWWDYKSYVKFVRSTRCFDLMKRQYSELANYHDRHSKVFYSCGTTVTHCWPKWHCMSCNYMWVPITWLGWHIII